MKKIIRFLIFGLSLFVILAAFKAGANSQAGAVDYSCPTNTGMVSSVTPFNNQTFPFGTPSVQVSWQAAPFANTYSVIATTNGSTIYSNADLPATSFPLSPLVDGNTYRVLIIPKNNCGPGAGSEVAFSVGTSPTAGQLTCSITQSLVGPYNNGYLYALSGSSPDSISTWQWNATGAEGPYQFATGQTARQQFYASTTVRLVVTDSSNRSGSCDTSITLPNSSTTTPGGSSSCSQYNAQPTRCVNQQLCTVNVTYNSGNVCNNNVDISNPYNCQYISGQCGYNPGGSNQCRSLSNCPPAPAGCSYSGRLTYSCDPNAILTCGILTGNCSSAGSFTTVTPGNGTTITNFNSSSSSSSSSNSNNNNITIK